MIRMRSFYTGFLGLLAIVACGSSKVEAPPPAAPVAEMKAPAAPHPSGMSSSQELGSIDPKLVEQAIQGVTSKITACRDHALSRIDFLAGDIKFFVRISQAGDTKWAFPEESTLGDRDTEMCMLHVLEKTKWPAPSGGEAEIQFPLSFEGGDARPPTEWNADKIAHVLGKHEADMKKCKAGSNRDYRVTAYVEPNGGSGRVMSVGVAVAKKEDLDTIECVVSSVRGWKMPSPGSYAAKVSFIF
jgi:hypothetical protein